MSSKIHPVILCGGSGTRLWPLSTPKTPKQFLTLTSSQSMIEETAARFKSGHKSDLEFGPILVVGSKQHQALLDKSLPDARKILEPFGRNSAPAVAAACLALDPEDQVLILPADHDIQDVPAFHDAIAIATRAAAEGAIVTFGINPTHPATGYGYIRAPEASESSGAKSVEAFVEKPQLEVARTYLESGSYFWNAGIFLFKASVMIEALSEFAPSVLSGTRSAMTTERDGRINLDADAFAATPSISIDYAVMERAENVKSVPVSMGWSDVGGYHALHELLTESESDNYEYGPVHVQNSQGLYVRSEGPTVSVNGLSNLVIVATDNEVMITPKDDDGIVKELGKIVQTDRQSLGLSTSMKEQAKNWLWQAFDFWSQKAWDRERGGFVEQLDMDGAPNLHVNRRVRVQARQIFSFSKAINLGWNEAGRARELVEQGIAYIDTRLRHPDGGWVHVTDPHGSAVDDKRDLYDHAFIILAGAAAFQATGEQKALDLADEAIEFVDQRMKDSEAGGWFESIPHSLPRRANPHMHMLEAMLVYHDATGDAEALLRAGESVRLFEKHFFDTDTDVMAEFFSEIWAPDSAAHADIWEPGHHFEWATLLCQFQAATQHDTLSWRRRLISRAKNDGLNESTGFPVNALTASGKLENSNSRLWHALEMFRAYLLHRQMVSSEEIERLFDAIMDQYLNAGPTGGWLDERDLLGEPIASSVPASMLYHVVTALEPLV